MLYRVGFRANLYGEACTWCRFRAAGPVPRGLRGLLDFRILDRSVEIERGEDGLGLLGDSGSGAVAGTRSRVTSGGVEDAGCALGADVCGVGGANVIGEFVTFGDCVGGVGSGRGLLLELNEDTDSAGDAGRDSGTGGSGRGWRFKLPSPEGKTVSGRL